MSGEVIARVMANIMDHVEKELSKGVPPKCIFFKQSDVSQFLEHKTRQTVYRALKELEKVNIIERDGKHWKLGSRFNLIFLSHHVYELKTAQ